MSLDVFVVLQEISTTTAVVVGMLHCFMDVEDMKVDLAATAEPAALG